MSMSAGPSDHSAAKAMSYTLLDALESKYPLHLSYLSHFIMVVQVLSFGLNTYSRHGEILESVAPVLYGFQFPIFDGITYFPISVGAAAGVMWAAAVLLLLAIATPALLAAVGVSVVRKKSVLFIGPRIVVHTLAGPLFLPLAHLFVSFLACDGSGHLWSYSEHPACFEGSHAIEFAGALVGLLALIVFTTTAESCLCDIDSTSAHPLARINTGPAVLALLWKVLAVILFHVLIPRDHSRWFAVFIACSGVLLVGLYATTLPYYSQRTNARMTATYFVMASAAIVTAIGDAPPPSTVTQMDIDGAVLLCLLGPLVVLGYNIAHFRVNRDYVRALPNLTDIASNKSPRPAFPDNLPGHDQSHPAFRAILAEVMDQPPADDGSDIVTLLIPFLKRVLFASDVEVACRFLDHFTAITKIEPGVKMLILATRTYTKGKTKFSQSGDVCLAFANMLFMHAGKPKAALAEVDWMGARTRPGFWLQYRGHRLANLAKAELNMRDASYQRVCTNAKKAYRDALEQVVVFWTRLAADQQDFAMLYTVASNISAKRNAALAEFNKAFAMNPHDRANAARYAVFVDHILMETGRAEAIQGALAAEAEERRWSAMRGARKGGKSAGATFDVTPFLEESEDSVDTSSRSRLYSILAYGACALLLLAVAGQIAFSVAAGVEHRSKLQGLKAYTVARGLATHGPIVASTIGPNVTSANGTAVANPEGNATTYGDLNQHLLASASDLRTTMNELTFGSLRTSDLTQLRLLQGAHSAAHQLDVTTVTSRHATSALATTTLPFFTLAYNLVEKIVSAIHVADSSDVQRDHRSALVTELLEDAEYNTPGAFAFASHVAVHTVAVAAERGTAVYAAFFGLSALLLIGLVTVVFANASRVSVFRVSILSLFVLVPRKIVRTLLEIAKGRLAHIEASDDAETTNTGPTIDETGDIDDEDQELLGADSAKKQASQPPPQQNDTSGSAESSGSEDNFGAVAGAMLSSAKWYGLTLAVALLVVASTAGFLGLSQRDGGHYDTRAGYLRQHQELTDKWQRVLLVERIAQRAVAIQDSRTATDIDTAGILIDAIQAAAINELKPGSVFGSIGSRQLSAQTSRIGDTTDPLPEVVDASHEDDETDTGADIAVRSSAALNSLIRHLVGGAAGTYNVNSSSTIVFTRAYRQRFATARNAVWKQILRLRTSVVKLEGWTSRWSTAFLAVASSTLLVLTMLVALFNTWRRIDESAVSTRRRFGFVALLLALCSAAPIVLTAVSISREAAAIDSAARAHTSIAEANNTVAAIFDSAARANRFVHIHDLREYRAYFDRLLFDGASLGVVDEELEAATLRADEVNRRGASLEDGPTRRVLKSFRALGSDDAEEDAGFPVSLGLLRSNITALIDAMRTSERVAVALAASAAQLPRRHTREVGDAVWDRSAESELSAVVDADPTDTLRYTTSAQDRAQPLAVQQQIAEYTLASPRYLALVRNISDIVRWQRVGVDAAESVLDAADDQSLVVVLMATSISFAALVTLCCIGLVAAAVRTELFARRTYRGVRSVRTAGEAAAVPSGMGSRAVPLIVSSVIIALLLLVLVVAGIQSEAVATAAASHVEAIGELQQRIGVATSAARRFEAGLVSKPVAAAAAQRHVREIREQWSAVLFGESDGLQVAGISEEIDSLLFQELDGIPAEYRGGVFIATGRTISDSLAAGIEGFSHALLEVPEVAPANVSAAVTEVVARYSAIYAHVRWLLDKVEAHEVDHRNVWTAVLGGLGGAVCVVLAAVFLTVLRPLLESLNADYDDATLMLRMMPQNVRDNVPAVAEFIQHTLAGAAGSSQIADMSYSAPIVVIDDKGTVIKFNAAAEECFGYDASEVTGNNVKMLMNDHDKRFHDDYLATYKRTGVRKVIGYERVVTAKRKNGELFPLQLNVKSHTRANGETVYIAFLADVTRRAELTRMEELNDVVQNLASVPIIAIDALGTVTRFNRAAERTFGHNSADVIGQNVKMLMPETIAKHHDAYLANYLRTGVKNVIDKQRRLTGVKKSGEEFQFELAVKEIVGDAGTQSTYLGFARDLTAALQLEEKNRINEQIATLSPIPVVGIDSFGKVLKFNRASENMFGYMHTEVVGQNIKMLMPEEIAVNHDGYLEAYRRTGKKNVIGGERVVDAKCKDGTIIPLRIHVGEAKHEGMRPIFLGYLVDIRQEQEDMRSAAQDDAVRGMATFPIITMNDVGTILTTNHAVVQEFGFIEEELKGENIKMLMPNEIAVNHDEYLRNYKIKRVRKVIGNARRVPAQRKNGTRVMVEIRVDEVFDADGNSIYIGFLRNITSDLELEQSHRINTLVQELSAVPMLAIDAKGTVLRFNASAENTWQRTREGVIGKNIKMLMPEFYAVQHDQYLDNYVRTGVKHIIDTRRCVEAERKDGTIFPAEVSVIEVPDLSEDRSKSIFVGYLRDVTKDGEAQQMILRNQVITALSPVPLIQIDRYGIITEFNKAAQVEFGYSAEEIKDRNVNVKILLPDALAAKHDGYLLNYQRTKKKSMIGNKRRDRAKRKDGTEFPIEAFVSEIVMDGEDHSFYSAYIRNISDMMELELTKVVSGVISDLSPIPLIAIKERGTVLQINAAGAARFGYDPSEVVGQNIKMLMPEATAKKHDGYLSAYAKTGEKHVIDTTRIVKAQSKTGEIFTVEIGVRELMTEVGGEKQRMYWGFLRDCTVDIQRDRGLKLAKAVLEMSTVPLLQIDHIGTIQEANPATTVTFGFSRDEMMGKNIKMLMPFQIAMRHDGFLKRYAETRVKSVIDTTREVEGQHKNGTVFKVEISVREVEREDGQPPVFVAYLIDLTERIERARLTQLTSATKSSSPMPLIVMDDMGYVLEFNGSAEELWNYQASEVIGQNIKMLMPEEIAVNHDGYLAKYRETGVQAVVGSTRMVHARRNGGEHLPVSITVREITLPGNRKRFVGYIEDRSGTYASLKAAVIGEQIIDMLPVGVIGIDEVGTVRMFNPHASELWGYAKDEVIGKNVKMLMPEDIAVRHDDILARYKATGVKSVVGTTRSVQAKLKAGTIVPVDLDVREYSVDGKKLFVGYCRDRRIMDQIADESELSHSMVKRSPEMIVVMDAVGQVLEFNQAAQTNFGFTHEEIAGKNIKALMPDDVAVNHDGYLRRYVETGVKKVIDGVTKTYAQRKDGTIFPVELRIREIKGRTREQSKFVGFVRDRTNDLVNEANAAVCAAIGQLMPDGLIVISDVGVVLTFTHQAEISFGYKAEEVIGQNIKMLTPPEIAREHDGYLSRYRDTGVKHVVDTTRRVNARRKNGSTFEAELRITEYKSNNEVFFIGFVRDCSDDYAEVIARTLTNSLFDVTPEAMIAIDKIGTIVNFNAAAESLFDFERSIALGRNIKILMPDKHALRHDQYLAQYQRHKIKRVVDNVRFVLAERKNGTTFPAEISVRETTDINGEPLFVGYLRDMTGRVDMKDVV